MTDEPSAAPASGARGTKGRSSSTPPRLHGHRGPLRDLLPDAGQVGERLGHDQAVVGAEPLQARVLGVEVPDAPPRPPRRTATAPALRSRSARPRASCRPPRRSSPGPRPRPRAGAPSASISPTVRSSASIGSSSSPNVSARWNTTSVSVEPWTSANSVRIDREHEVAAQRVEVGDEAVVHEQPAARAERMAVGLLHRRADRGPHVRQEQRRLDVRGQLAQVRVAPRRRHAAVDGRARRRRRTSPGRSRRRWSARRPCARAGSGPRSRAGS